MQSQHVFTDKIGLNDLKEILADDELMYREVNLKQDDIAVVMYTSGTTGKPKGVMLTHLNIYETGSIWSESMDLTAAERVFICTPLFHCAGLHVFAVSTLFVGGAIIIEEAPAPT